MRSPTLLPMRMNAAETSASSAMADCTLLTVVSRSSTTAAIDTFISDVSTTSTNIAMAKRSGSRRSVVGAPAGSFVIGSVTARIMAAFAVADPSRSRWVTPPW